MSKENTAVFIGHNECYGVTSEQIKEAIVSLIDKGVTEFLSGGQGGFDRLCGRCVYELKKEYRFSLLSISDLIPLRLGFADMGLSQHSVAVLSRESPMLTAYSFA